MFNEQMNGGTVFFVQAPYMYRMQKGRLFIYQLMKADGHLPIMEQKW